MIERYEHTVASRPPSAFLPGNRYSGLAQRILDDEYAENPSLQAVNRDEIA